MRRALALLVLLVAGGCLAAEPPERPVVREVPANQGEPAPDLTGQWLLTPVDEGYRQLWTITQLGGAITGEIGPDPEDLPEGVTVQPRPIRGRVERFADQWVFQMETPAGRVIWELKDQWSFCPKLGGPSECLTARRRVVKASPSPTPPPLP